MERKFNPLDPSFNAAVMTMAGKCFPGGYRIDTIEGGEAPSTFAGLEAQFAANKYVASGGNSDRTIYDCEETNAAFRAWHDWCHVRGGFDLTLEGEYRTCEYQADMLIDLFGFTERVRGWIKILRAEVIGQAEHLQAYGEFPYDQKAFVEAYMANGLQLPLQRY